MKVLVLYVFHIYNKRVEYFINHCIVKEDNIDFIIICNNKDTKVRVPTYVKQLFRDNIGYDFGGWSDALLTNNLYDNYTHFIFVNSSVIGPYLPSTFTGKWTDVYLNGLQGNVKLFGSTINTCNKPFTHSHVQSYIFSMDKNTLNYLIQCEIFSMTNYAKTFDDAIQSKEILMSRKVIENNWNIGSCMTYYKDVDFTFKSKQVLKPFLGDICNTHYYNTIWNEYEVVFIKGNRGLPISFPNSLIKVKQNIRKLLLLSIFF